MTKKRSKNRRNPSKKQDLSVFDFSPEDERIEKRSKKLLQTFKNHKPNKFHSPVDKYCFLRCFAGEISSSQNDSVNEILRVDDSDDVAEKKILESVAIVAFRSSNLKPSTDYRLCHLESKCDTSGAKSHLTRVKTPECSVTEGEDFSRRVDNELVILDSDDATEVESSKPTCYLPENKGSGNQHEFMQSPNLCNTKVPVVVKPDHIMYEDTYSTSSILTFSCSSIKLEGSFGMKLPFTSEWTLCDILTINSEWCKSVETALVELYLKSKDADVANTDIESSGAIVLTVTLFDPDWSEIQEAIKMLDVRYKDKWNDITALDPTRSYSPFFGRKSFSVSEHHHPNSRDNFEEIVFPEGDPDAVSISKRDVDLLKPKTFVNDTIIDFYIMYLKNKMNPEEKDRFHFFNSFFFRKLADLDRDPSRPCEGRAAFLRVRRWATKVDLFGKDFIFIPVNFSLHWSLIVICHPGEVVTFREEEMEKSSRVPCILHMDSIRGSHKGLKNLIQSYLLEEWKERHKEVGEDVARKFSRFPFVRLELPQQGNSFDCGLFLLHYVELFLEQAPVNFSLSLISASSKFLSENWFSTEDVDCKREHIKRLICEITKNRTQKVSPADFDDNSYLNCLEEENTSLNLLQETCNAREACYGDDLSSREDELPTLSPVANLIRGFKSAGVSEVAFTDLSRAPDSAKTLTYDSCWLYGQKASLDPFRNVMSPIEEEAIEEQMTLSPAMKAGSQPVEFFAAPHASSSLRSETLFLGRISSSLNSDKMNPGCQSSSGYGFPNSIEIHDEEDLRAKVEEVSDPDAAKYNSPTSPEELAGYIVLDSQEEDENHDWNGLENNLPNTSALCHREANSTDIYVYKVNEMILSSQLVEQAAKKPRQMPEVLEVSSSGTGKDQIVSSSTSSEELTSCFVQDSEEVNSKLCTEAINLKPETGSGKKPFVGKARHLFRRPRRVRIDLS
ncbi:probable ubiquitin-like-specific protease 2A isoform X2 [Solanum dulcamara]|uniref:probable ubiquitin-like-specific protease 2A isoform X2 n=1 Tax=Solanum dulcamara TaxID=45834 RepID=UPI00248609C8|nr:probable ubiquitin-like-specific protease 2A isoform X2 [Solanum dulcamara]